MPALQGDENMNEMESLIKESYHDMGVEYGGNGKSVTIETGDGLRLIQTINICDGCAEFKTFYPLEISYSDKTAIYEKLAELNRNILLGGLVLDETGYLYHKSVIDPKSEKENITTSIVGRHIRFGTYIVSLTADEIVSVVN